MLKLAFPVSSRIYKLCHGKNIKLGGYSIKTNSKYLHGKNAKKTRKLVKKAEIMYNDIYVGKEQKILMLGVTLHSIQDFYAHSYVSDLENFKKNKKNFRKRSIKIQVYHHDWVTEWCKIKIPPNRKDNYAGRGKKYLDRRIEHVVYKDDPYRDFDEIGNWSEKTLPSKHMNKRYRDALSDTTSFLRTLKLNPKLRLALRK